MSYATLSEFKAAVGITDTTDDTALQSVLDATDTLIDLTATARLASAQRPRRATTRLRTGSMC